jgi:hypothetical protein
MIIAQQPEKTLGMTVITVISLYVHAPTKNAHFEKGKRQGSVTRSYRTHSCSPQESIFIFFKIVNIKKKLFWFPFSDVLAPFSDYDKLVSAPSLFTHRAFLTTRTILLFVSADCIKILLYVHISCGNMYTLSYPHPSNYLLCS